MEEEEEEEGKKWQTHKTCRVSCDCHVVIDFSLIYIYIYIYVCSIFLVSEPIATAPQAWPQPRRRSC